jgi:hypothetical protein
MKKKKLFAYSNTHLIMQLTSNSGKKKNIVIKFQQKDRLSMKKYCYEHLNNFLLLINLSFIKLKTYV